MMKKMICFLVSTWMLILSLASGMAEGASGLQILVCQEEGFSVTCDAGFTSEYVEGEGFTVYTRQFRNYPYVLISVDRSESRVIDGADYITNSLRPVLENYAKQNGAYGIVQYGEYQIAGRDVAAMSLQFYDEYGTKFYFLAAYDVHEDYTVFYRIRYMNPEDEQETIAALNQIAANLRPASGTETQISGHVSEPLNFAVTEVMWNGMVAGRVTAPAGSTVSGGVSYGKSIEAPWLLNVTVTTPEGYVMGYASKQNYLDILRWDGGTGHQDGLYNVQLHSNMLHYRDAAAYCDYAMVQMRGELPPLVAEETFPQADAMLRNKEKALYAKANELSAISNVGVDWVKCSVCMRRYAADVAGIPSYYCLLTGVQALQSTASVPGILLNAVISTISWDVLFNYLIICPQADWDTYSQVFTQFVENTSATDEFDAANERLSIELVNIIAASAPDLSGGSAYSESVLSSELSSGDEYTDRYSDYLFDQNDYTLSDGSHVKVSTAYDYVYQGDNGNVYYSDSAFAQPGGSVQLYPNR